MENKIYRKISVLVSPLSAARVPCDPGRISVCDPVCHRASICPCRRMPGHAGCFCRRGGIHGGDHGSVSAGNGAGASADLCAPGGDRGGSFSCHGDPDGGSFLRGTENWKRKPASSFRRKARAGRYWMLAVFGFAGSLAATCLMTMMQAVFYDSLYQQTSAETYSSPFVIQIICLGFVIPLAEEFMFRGVLYKRYRERPNFWYSAIGSSILFFTHACQYDADVLYISAGADACLCI